MARGFVAALSAVLLTACSAAVDGAPGRVQSTALPDVLPSPTQVADAVGNPLDPTGPAVAGSIAVLPNGIRDSSDVSPLDCLGAATPLMRAVYQRGDVRDVALRDFSRYGQGLTVSSAHTGVVRFTSAAEAARMFSTFVRQWQGCDNTAVDVHVSPTSTLTWRVTEVRKVDGILSATVLSGDAVGQSTFPTERALGITGDCIVDVDVALTDVLPARRTAAGRRAAGLAEAIIDNINRSR